MSNRKTLFKKLSLRLLVALFIVFTVFGSFMFTKGTVYAEPFVNPEDRARAWQATRYIKACLENEDLYGSVSDGGRTKGLINNGEIFGGNSAVANDANRVGYILDPANGELVDNCQKDGAKTAFNVFSGSIFDIVVTKTDVYIPDPNNGDKWILPDTYNRESAKNKILNYIKQEYDIDTSKPLSRASQYISLKFTFDQACKIRDDYDSIAEASQQENANTAIYIEVDKKTGEPTNKFVTVEGGDHAVGDGIDKDSNGDQRMNCQEIAAGLAETWEDYSNRIKDLLARGIDPTASLTTNEKETKLTCEEAVNDSYAWIACPTLSFLENTVEFFFNFADGLLSVDAQAIGENDSLRAAWGFFRVVATSMLIVIGLVMVFSQAMGGGN